MGLASQASAAAVLRYSADGTAASAQDNLVVNGDLGETFRFSVFLFETAGDTRLSATGLNTAGFQANFNTGLGTVSNPTTDAGFGFAPPATVDNASGTVVAGGGVNLFSPARPGRGTGNALIGFFDYTIEQRGTTTFTFTDPNPGSTADNVLDDAPAFTDLDPEVFANPGTITVVSAVPEPSTILALGGLAGCAMLRRRRR
ncbi:PEP-CTERM sorting domain-containing protein [Stieleria maiorica]|uniref:PEP-CTERM sorting domain-containing protein n=1 Tax=Stieleria maiorica TaxID=2795974 RepID=UPI00142F2E42|nr:PEP-CTERM sorting domain-containing protein [Stieleria maiorica]